MPSFFYLYTFAYLITRLYYLIQNLFFYKKEEPVEIGLNMNIPEAINKLMNFGTLIALVNTGWIVTGIFAHETVLFCILFFIDFIGITPLFNKEDPNADRKYGITMLTVKVVVSCYIIYLHFYDSLCAMFV